MQQCEYVIYRFKCVNSKSFYHYECGHVDRNCCRLIIRDMLSEQLNGVLTAVTTWLKLRAGGEQ